MDWEEQSKTERTALCATRTSNAEKSPRSQPLQSYVPQTSEFRLRHRRGDFFSRRLARPSRRRRARLSRLRQVRRPPWRHISPLLHFGTWWLGGAPVGGPASRRANGVDGNNRRRTRIGRRKRLEQSRSFSARLSSAGRRGTCCHCWSDSVAAVMALSWRLSAEEKAKTPSGPRSSGRRAFRRWSTIFRTGCVTSTVRLIRSVTRSWINNSRRRSFAFCDSTGTAPDHRTW